MQHDAQKVANMRKALNRRTNKIEFLLELVAPLAAGGFLIKKTASTTFQSNGQARSNTYVVRMVSGGRSYEFCVWWGWVVEWRREWKREGACRMQVDKRIL
jgi:hypothetical protein